MYCPSKAMQLANDITGLKPSVCLYFLNTAGWTMDIGFERLSSLNILDCLSHWYTN